jgi:HNH endonuclease
MPYGPPRTPLATRFWKFVEPEPNSGCWLWSGAQNRRGYGAISIARSRMREAHRIMWQLEYGRIPDGMHVLHRCDVPPCVNPGHLWLGTRRDNMQDASKKGRIASQKEPARYTQYLEAWRQRQPRGTSPRSQRRHARMARLAELVRGEALG